MKAYKDWEKKQLEEELRGLEKKYLEEKELNHTVNMARGKPGAAQLALSMKMFDEISSDMVLVAEDGTDLKNYGVCDGISEAKVLMGEIMGCDPANVLVWGNASLEIMYSLVSYAMNFGVLGGEPWNKQSHIKFLCPVPGYDRHFRITETFGIEMINIPMNDDGPDMDMIEKLVADDESIKGIWCVPKFSNPGGVVYSEEVVKRFASLSPKAEDFRIFWDNAYVIHDLEMEHFIKFPDIISMAAEAGNPDIVYEFASTSKVTFAGAGISAVAASKANLDSIRKNMGVQTIGYDKINQWLHVKFLKDLPHTLELMSRQGELLKPKFDLVDAILREDLGKLEIGKWSKPQGGYFICFNALPGCAGEIVRLAKDAGLTLTGAGAPFPYGRDPEDSVIRIAPSYPDLPELEIASRLFTLCVRIASLRKYLAR